MQNQLNSTIGYMPSYLKQTSNKIKKEKRNS